MFNILSMQVLFCFTLTQQTLLIYNYKHPH